MKAILFFLLILIFQSNTIAQSFVTGTVIDATSKKPVNGATVFVDGTTMYSITDSSGKFFIDQIKDQHVELIVFKTGFESINYPLTIQTKNYNIRFELLHEDTLPSVSDSILKLQQERWGRIFFYRILGTSPNALQCEIVNPQVLRFLYTPSDSGYNLRIKAIAPLIVFNEALGYMITCVLDDFTVSPTGDTYFKIYKWYKPLSSKNKTIVAKWMQARENVYKGSMMHFMRTLFADSLDDHQFETKFIIRINANDSAYSRLSRIQKETNTSVFSYGT